MASSSPRQPPSSGLVIPGSHVEIQMDVLEWICHALISQSESTDPRVVKELGVQFEDALSQIGENKFVPYGRIQNRLHLTALTHELAGREGTECQLDKISATVWKDIRDHFEHSHSLLTRKDADAGPNEEVEDEAVNPEIAELPIFSEEYESALALIDIHGIVATFRRRLEKLRKKRSNKDLTKEIETTIDAYKAEISNISTNVDTSPLTDFLIPNLYKSAKTKTSVPQLVSNILDDLNERVSDEKQDFSWSNTREQLLYLLKRWHQRVLSTPTLVNCGYRGVTSGNFPDDMSVSSWGEGNGEEEEEGFQPEPLTQPPEPQRVIHAAPSEDDMDAYMTADEDDPELKRNDSDGSPIVLPTVDEKEEENESEEKVSSPKLSKKKPSPAKARRSRRLADDGEDDANEKENYPRRSRRLADEDVENEALASARKTEKKPTPNSGSATALPDEDPDDEDIDSPAPAKKTPRKSTQPKKRKPPLVQWPDSSDDEDADVARWIPPRTTPAKQKRARRSLDSTATPKSGQKRRSFTDEEKNAIKDGVLRFGKGKWAVIRLNSNGVLLSRTPQQIKDCVRNMEKKNAM